MLALALFARFLRRCATTAWNMSELLARHLRTGDTKDAFRNFATHPQGWLGLL